MMLRLYCHKQVKTVTVEKKLNEIVNRLNKTCEERQPDLRAEREERDRQERLERRRLQEEEVRIHRHLIGVTSITIFCRGREKRRWQSKRRKNESKGKIIMS